MPELGSGVNGENGSMPCEVWQTARTGVLMFTAGLGVVHGSGAGRPEVEGGVQVATTVASQPDGTTTRTTG